MAVKEEIMNKAIYLFADKGYDSIGVAKIVDDVHVTKPTLYHYFGNKEGLLRSIIEYYYQPFLNQLMTTTEYNNDIILTVEEVCIAYVTYAVKDPVYYRLCKNLHHSPLNSNGYQVFKPFRDQEFKLLSDMFKSVAKHHTNLSAKETILTYSFLGMIDAFISYHLENGTLTSTDEKEWRQLGKQFLYGIFAI